MTSLLTRLRDWLLCVVLQELDAIKEKLVDPTSYVDDVIIYRFYKGH